MTRKNWLKVTIFVGLLQTIPNAQAITYSVSIDTSALLGNNAQLAFDFIDGGIPSNNVSISDFFTDGSLGSNSGFGGISGSLPGTLTLSDTGFLNEYLTDITFGNSLSFLFTATNNAPDVGSSPDAFSILFIDTLTGLSLLPTTDPTGADTLFRFDIDGSSTGLLDSYSAIGGQVITTISEARESIPEPEILYLLSIGIVALRIFKKR